jgi:hypothetical protein
MVCPLCDSALSNVQIRELGRVTAGLNWEMHAGKCEAHGWFQAEMISKPPREIFAVKQPGGVARKMLVAGRPVYAFPTVWNAVGGRKPVDPYDPEMWAIDWSSLPGGIEEVVLTSA